tara:strand:+ start:162 stop:431 length:270 start_codon:yes stop_codon:yes gene_type:complete
MLKNKKSVHINIDQGDHANFKVQCVKRELSMQEVFAAFAHRVGIEGADMLRLLDRIALDKNVKKAKKVYTKSDMDTIFSMIEDDNIKKE